MDTKARQELQEARIWLNRHKSLALAAGIAVVERHPAVWFSNYMTKLSAEIRLGRQAAVALGVRFIADDPKTPFGRISKRKILKALKHSAHLIPQPEQHWISLTLARLDQLPHKPHEYGDLKRLVRRMTEVD